MASGNIREIKTKTGEIHYQITVEGGYDPLTGKRIRAYKNVKGSKREANSVMHKMITEMEDGKLTKKSPLTVSAWMDVWLGEYLPNIEETTRIGYRTKIKCHIKPSIGDIFVSSLRAEHIQRMVNGMIADGLAPKSIRDTYNILNKAMKKTVKLQIIAHNPCEGVELPKLKKYRADIYTPTMIQTILDKAKDTDMYLPIYLLVKLGLRRGELLALRWSDIDFKNNVLKVRHNMVRTEESYTIKEPKSEAGIRDIHLSKEVSSILKQERIKYMNDLFNYGAGFQNLEFVIRQENGAPYHPDSMSQKWRRFLEKHNLPQRRLHDLRHSNATALIQAGVSPKVVQQRLGHADVQITLNTYTHVLPEMDVEAAEKLDEFMLKQA